MSLLLLLDEHVSAAVATQVQRKATAVRIMSVYEWRDGALVGKDDDPLLAAAAEEGLTLVTYDQKTLRPMLTEWALSARSHAGGVFVDDKTIAPNDIAALVKAILGLWEQSYSWDRTDRVVFLRPVSVDP